MGECFWTDEKVAALKRCIDEKLSASAIGVLLGCSRNAVIGKTRRLKRRLQSIPAGSRAVLATEAQAAALGVALPSGAPVGVVEEPRVIRPKHERIFKPLPDFYEPPVEDAPGLAIEDLKMTHCRAITNNAPVRYCGEPIAHDRFSYCKKHFAAYFVTPPKLKARRLERI